MEGMWGSQYIFEDIATVFVARTSVPLGIPGEFAMPINRLR